MFPAKIIAFQERSDGHGCRMPPDGIAKYNPVILPNRCQGIFNGWPCITIRFFFRFPIGNFIIIIAVWCFPLNAEGICPCLLYDIICNPFTCPAP